MKTEDKLLSLLLSVSYTKISLSSLIRLLREYLENKYFKKGSAKIPPGLKNLSASFFKEFNKNNAYLLLKKLEKGINNLAPYHLYLPFQPDEKEIEKLGIWFKKNISKNSLLEIHTDSSLTLGAAVAYKGVYKDFSLKYFIKNYRNDMLNILNKYEKNTT